MLLTTISSMLLLMGTPVFAADTVQLYYNDPTALMETFIPVTAISEMPVCGRFVAGQRSSFYTYTDNLKTAVRVYSCPTDDCSGGCSSSPIIGNAQIRIVAQGRLLTRPEDYYGFRPASSYAVTASYYFRFDWYGSGSCSDIVSEATMYYSYNTCTQITTTNDIQFALTTFPRQNGYALTQFYSNVLCLGVPIRSVEWYSGNPADLPYALPDIACQHDDTSSGFMMTDRYNTTGQPWTPFTALGRSSAIKERAPHGFMTAAAGILAIVGAFLL